jgi:hypothetical protein
MAIVYWHFAYFVPLAWRWPFEVETCCHIEDITQASSYVDGILFLLLLTCQLRLSDLLHWYGREHYCLVINCFMGAVELVTNSPFIDFIKWGRVHGFCNSNDVIACSQWHTPYLLFPLYGIRRSVFMIRDEIFEIRCRPNGHETGGF